jgi:hypothetical protein
VFWPHVRGFKKGALMPQMICLKDVAIAGNVLSSAALAGSRAERLRRLTPNRPLQVQAG